MNLEEIYLTGRYANALGPNFMQLEMDEFEHLMEVNNLPADSLNRILISMALDSIKGRAPFFKFDAEGKLSFGYEMSQKDCDELVRIHQERLEQVDPEVFAENVKKTYLKMQEQRARHSIEQERNL